MVLITGKSNGIFNIFLLNVNFFFKYNHRHRWRRYHRHSHKNTKTQNSWFVWYELSVGMRCLHIHIHPYTSDYETNDVLFIILWKVQVCVGWERIVVILTINRKTFNPFSLLSCIVELNNFHPSRSFVIFRYHF